MNLKRFSTSKTLRLTTLVALVAGLGFSQTTAGSAPSVLRTGDNYRLGAEEVPFRVKTAPGLAVNPANPNHVVATMFDLATEECQYAASDDGGATWDGPKNLVAPEGFYQEGQAPCTVLGHGANAMDAGVAFGNNGVYVTWATDAKTANDSQSVLISRSTNGGHSFPVGTVVMRGANPFPAYRYPKLLVIPGGGDNGADKVILSADNTRMSEITHANVGNAEVAVSNDNGATWSDPIQVNRQIDTRTTLTNPDGTTSPNPGYEPYGAAESTKPVALGNDVYMAWRTTTKQVLNPATGVTAPLPITNPEFPKGKLRIAKSTDGGSTWAQSDVFDVEGYVYTGPGGIAPYGGGPGTTQTSRFNGSSFPGLAAGNGNVYLTWAQHTGWYNNSGTAVAQDHFQIQNSAVWFARSSNPTDPASWSAPLEVNASPINPASQQFSPKKGEDPRTANQTTTINAKKADGSVVDDPIENHQNDTQTRHPNISVAPDGRIDLVWHDRRHAYKGCSQTHVACNDMRLGDTYYSYSTNGGATWSPNRRITDRSINNDVGYDYKFSTYWDYGPVSVPVGNSGVLFAWMDSREGNYDTDAQDIYLAKLNLNDAGNPTVKSLGSGQAGVLSAALSKAANPGGSEGRLAGTFSSQNATSVTIAKAGDQAGMLAGGVLARANGGPLLLAATGGLLPETKAEITRMGPLNAYLIGDTKALSKQVENDLAALGVPIKQRITGTGATLSKNVAAAIDRRTSTAKTAGLPAFDAAVITTATGPDAVAASTLAANRRLPVLFVDKTAVPADTASALSSLNINKTLVIGGPDVVNDSVLASLPNPTRLGGANQYETSKAVLQASVNDWKLPTNNVFVANGTNPQHGALLGSGSGRIGGLMLLTPNGTADEAKAVLDSLGLTIRVDRILTSTLTQ
ncbi:MAG TPA: cell wall-binding repeat-containing protein [Acidimicrobiales bacterium]|nr:cell wall-binding repeat-containing protein [Acidimicrobiales bacterium]